MTIGNALTFITRGLTESDLRDRLNAAASVAERDEVLVQEKFAFSDHDFDEAFHNRLTLCQAQEEADQLREFKMWWDLLSQIISPAGCGSHCGSCCS
jgi:hypothetical protein